MHLERQVIKSNGKRSSTSRKAKSGLWWFTSIANSSINPHLHLYLLHAEQKTLIQNRILQVTHLCWGIKMNSSYGNCYLWKHISTVCPQAWKRKTSDAMYCTLKKTFPTRRMSAITYQLRHIKNLKLNFPSYVWQLFNNRVAAT